MNPFYATCLLLLATHSTMFSISQDFSRRYGASSRLLQKPLYFSESIEQKCRNCRKKELCTQNIKKNVQTKMVTK